MWSPMTLFVFGHAYFFGVLPNTTTPTGGTFETPLSSVNTPLLNQTRIVKRPDYTYVPGLNGYKLHTQAVVWAAARTTCQEEGGHLAIINSEAEAIAISQVFKDAEGITGSDFSTKAWIGYHDLYREGEYVTIHEDSLVKAGYNRWDSDQPNNLNTQNCGGVGKNGLLDDLWYNKPFGFICEIPVAQDNVGFGAVNVAKRGLSKISSETETYWTKYR